MTTFASALAELATDVSSAWTECKQEIKAALNEYADELKNGGKNPAPDTPSDKEEGGHTTATTPRELARKLDRLHTEAFEFGFQVNKKLLEAQSFDRLQANSATLHQCEMDKDPDFFWESLAEKALTPISRRFTLSDYNSLKRECRHFLERLNQSAEMQQARKLLGSSATLKFNFNAALPDSDVALDNQDWEDNMSSAFDNFLDFSSEIMNQLERIEAELEQLEESRA